MMFIFYIDRDFGMVIVVGKVYNKTYVKIFYKWNYCCKLMRFVFHNSSKSLHGIMNITMTTSTPQLSTLPIP
jgi:hypothetical protein